MFIVFMGPPGVGKGTQCRRLSQYLKIPHLSTGDMFREAIEAGTGVGIQAAAFVEQGQLVPDGLVLRIVTDRVDQPDCVGGCLLDGFPRTLAQAESLDGHLARRQQSIKLVLLLSGSPEELQRRMLQRAQAENRTDDRPETIRKRLEVFHAKTAPLIEYYSSRSLLQSIDGMGTPDEVFNRIRTCVDVHRR